MNFENLSNEVILCIWDQLSTPDVIFSFCHLNYRINSLLYEFYGLFKTLDLRFGSLSACRYFCRQVPTMTEWRLGLTVLKLGNRYRCCQLEMFANETAKSFVANHCASRGIQCNNMSKDFFRILITFNEHMEPLFPQLVSLVFLQSRCMDDDIRDTLLFVAASGSAMRKFDWTTYLTKTHHTKSFFDWLFRCSGNLNSYRLINPLGKCGFELTYEYTIINGYVPHQSLTYLNVDVLNLTTLRVLLHYLPQLQNLGNYYRTLHVFECDIINHLKKTNYNVRLMFDA
jgi:hypothetical protein